MRFTPLRVAHNTEHIRHTTTVRILYNMHFFTLLTIQNRQNDYPKTIQSGQFVFLATTAQPYGSHLSPPPKTREIRHKKTRKATSHAGS